MVTDLDAEISCDQGRPGRASCGKTRVWSARVDLSSSQSLIRWSVVGPEPVVLNGGWLCHLGSQH